MTSSGQTAQVLKNLISREGIPGGIPAMTPMRAFRLAVSKAGQLLPVTRLRLAEFRDERTTLGEFRPGLRSETLLLTLTHPGGATGLLVLGGALVQTLTSARTAQALPKAKNPDHVPTRIDFVVLKPLVTGLLAAFDEMSAGLDLAPIFADYKIGDFVSDRDALFLGLPEVPYRQLHARLGWGLGEEHDELSLVVPVGSGAASRGQARQQSPLEWQQLLESNILRAEGALETRLAPLSITLEKLRGLQIGSDLVIPAESLSAVRLLTLDGKLVARGRLGQLAGSRAIRVSEIP